MAPKPLFEARPPVAMYWTRQRLWRAPQEHKRRLHCYRVMAKQFDVLVTEAVDFLAHNKKLLYSAQQGGNDDQDCLGYALDFRWSSQWRVRQFARVGS